MEPLSSASWAAFLRIRETFELYTVENMSSLDLEDETYCGDSKARGLEDVPDGVFGEETPKQRDPGPDFHLAQFLRSSEDDSLVILHGLIPFEGPDCA